MTAFAIVVACLAFILVVGVVRGQPGRGVADVTLLVFLLGIVAVVHLLFSQFVDAGDAGWSVAVVLAGAFALDSLYGLMAPERQRLRDKRLRRLMKRRA